MPGRSPSPGRSPPPGRSPGGRIPGRSPAPGRCPGRSTDGGGGSDGRVLGRFCKKSPAAPPPGRGASRVVGRSRFKKFCNWPCDGRVALGLPGLGRLPPGVPMLGLPAPGFPILGLPPPGRADWPGSVLGRETEGRLTLGRSIEGRVGVGRLTFGRPPDGNPPVGRLTWGRGLGRLIEGLRPAEGRLIEGARPPIDGRLMPPRLAPPIPPRLMPPPRPPPPPPRPRASAGSQAQNKVIATQIETRRAWEKCIVEESYQAVIGAGLLPLEHDLADVRQEFSVEDPLHFLPSERVPVEGAEDAGERSAAAVGERHL